MNKQIVVNGTAEIDTLVFSVLIKGFLDRDVNAFMTAESLLSAVTTDSTVELILVRSDLRPLILETLHHAFMKKEFLTLVDHKRIVIA